MAKHVLGFANFGGGGCIVVGVKQENGDLISVGLSTLTDKSKILRGLYEYLPGSLRRQVNLLDFSFEESEYPTIKGKSFQVLIVEDDSAHLPFLAIKQKPKILRRNTVYTRRGVATEEADHDELQRIINRRLETGYSSRSELDLNTHLEQLKVLFEKLSPYTTESMFKGVTLDTRGIGVFTKRVPNLAYPEEDYGTFVARAIARKKRRIEIELDIENIPSSESP